MKHFGVVSRYIVAFPTVPGLPPSPQGQFETLAEARDYAREQSRGRRDLRGSDVRIERPNGDLVEYAGVGS